MEDKMVALLRLAADFQSFCDAENITFLQSTVRNDEFSEYELELVAAAQANPVVYKPDGQKI